MTEQKRPNVVECPKCERRYLDHVEKCSECGTPNPKKCPGPGKCTDPGCPAHYAAELDKWDSRFLQAAAMFASWSKDPSTKVGAVLVDRERRILGTGYNGFPRGVEDSIERLENRDLKYPLTAHAEVNAILGCTLRPAGATLYVYPYPPCHECTKAIIQAGVRRVVIGLGAGGPNKVEWMKRFHEFSAPMLEEAGVGHETWEIDLV